MAGWDGGGDRARGSDERRWTRWRRSACRITPTGPSANFPVASSNALFLARALVQDARLYLMDEPFAAVDAVTERAIVHLMQELRAAGRTVIVVHHDLQTVRRYFDWLLLLNIELVACGPTDEVFTAANLQRTYGGSIALVEDMPLAAGDLQKGK